MYVTETPRSLKGTLRSAGWEGPLRRLDRGTESGLVAEERARLSAEHPLSCPGRRGARVRGVRARVRAGPQARRWLWGLLRSALVSVHAGHRGCAERH